MAILLSVFHPAHGVRVSLVSHRRADGDGLDCAVYVHSGAPMSTLKGERVPMDNLLATLDALRDQCSEANGWREARSVHRTRAQIRKPTIQ